MRTVAKPMQQVLFNSVYPTLIPACLFGNSPGSDFHSVQGRKLNYLLFFFFCFTFPCRIHRALICFSYTSQTPFDFTTNTKGAIKFRHGLFFNKIISWGFHNTCHLKHYKHFTEVSNGINHSIIIDIYIPSFLGVHQDSR